MSACHSTCSASPFLSLLSTTSLSSQVPPSCSELSFFPSLLTKIPFTCSMVGRFSSENVQTGKIHY